MVTEAVALAMRALLAAALLLAMPGAAHTSDGAARPIAALALTHAQSLFEQHRYRETVDLLEALPPSLPAEAAVHLLLGKAYGRMAEREPWYRAMTYARRCGVELARAVELEPRNRDALAALARFYEEAPAVVGGSADKAAAVRQRLDALD